MASQHNPPEYPGSHRPFQVVISAGILMIVLQLRGRGLTAARRSLVSTRPGDVHFSSQAEAQALQTLDETYISRGLSGIRKEVRLVYHVRKAWKRIDQGPHQSSRPETKTMH